MRPSRFLPGLFILGFKVSFSSLAVAGVGSDAQNFNPTTSGIDFVTVQSGQTLDSGVFNFGAFLNYSVNSLSFLEKADPSSVQNRLRLNDKLLSMDLSFGLGLTDNWEVGLSLPFLLQQDISNSDQVAYFAAKGNTEQRLNTKYRFFNDGQTHIAAVLSVANNNIADNPYLGEGGGLTSHVEIAASRKWSDSWLGFNFGHRFRNSGKSLASRFGFDPLPNQWTYSAAWSRHLAKIDSKLIFELFGSTPTKSNDTNLTNRDLSNLEALAGIKHEYSENLDLHAGVGTEVIQGFGTPDYRIYLGLNWSMGPLWKKPSREVFKEIVQSPPENEKRFVLTNLKFKFDSDELTLESQLEVDQLVAVIQEIKDAEEIQVEGHTDSSGPEAYNLKLSQRRAAAIMRLLAVQVPFEKKRIRSEGFGESRPVAENGNYQGRALNRRVVVIVRTKRHGEIQLSK